MKSILEDLAETLAKAPYTIHVLEDQTVGGSPTYINIMWQPPRGGVETIPAGMFSPPS